MEILFLVVLILLMAWALASGYPVAFALPGSAIGAVLLAALCGWLFAGDPAAYFHQSGPSAWLTAGVTNFRGVYWEPERDTLIAIPLFVFMGIVLQRSKIAEDLLMTMAQLFGPIPGGLGISVVFVGALLAATTGILGATVVAMGLISLPAMLRNKYSTPLATGTIAASGTLGQIIPPSIVLIILADQLSSAVDVAGNARRDLYVQSTGEFSLPSEFGVTSTSAGDMFMGALVPGLILVGLYMLFILVIALVRPKMAPAVRMGQKLDLRMALKIVLTLVPPLALIFVVLGSIILGIATVTQAGAIGAAGAMIMAGYRLYEGRRRAFWPAILAVASLVTIFILLAVHPVNVKAIATAEDSIAVLVGAVAVALFSVALAWSGWRMYRVDRALQGVMIETAKTTSLVFIILIGAAMLTAAFRAFGGEDLVRDFLNDLPGGFWTQFVIVMLVIFILGFFLDFIEIAVVVVPIVAPILLMDPEANVTAVWLGVMIGLNIQTSFLSPPFGFALFYLRGVATSAVKTIQIYKGVVPFIALQLIALVIVGLSPALVNYLPMRITLASDTAPPPVNPRLQYCIEEYVFEQFDENGEAIRAAVAEARSLPLESLPAGLQRDLGESFEAVGSVFGQLEEIRAAHAVVQEGLPAYKPLHAEVRALEGRIRRGETRLADLDTRIGRLNADEEELRADLEAQRAALAAELESLRAQIPADWEETHKAFLALVNAEENARRAYRRTVDEAYAPAATARALIETTDDLAALSTQFDLLAEAIENRDPSQVVPLENQLTGALREANATDDVTGPLSKARREAAKDSPDWTAVEEQFAEGFAAYGAELAWRQEMVAEAGPGLLAYEAAIRDTVGLRQQPRIPGHITPAIAACSAEHRDISISF